MLHEAAGLDGFITRLRERASSAEIIIVDAADSPCLGQSVIELCDRVLTTGRGRAVQMNAGAQAATGDVLWFIHADCEVADDCLQQIARAISNCQCVGGCFRIRFPQPQLIYRISDVAGNVAVELFGRCYGDHGIFCRRQDFLGIGGFPELPLFEDAEFYRRLRRRGRTRQLGSYIITSARRYQEVGPYRLTAAYVLLSILYFVRVPIPLLARLYHQLCRSDAERERLAG